MSILDTPDNLARFFTLYPGVESGRDLDDPEKRQKTHWFLCSPRGWNSGTDLVKEIGHRRRMDRNAGYLTIYYAALYLVPGESDREYDLDNGVPQVEGTVFISKLHWRKPPK